MSSATLERRKWIYNLVQHQELGRLAVLTLLASPNPPHLGPLALEKKSKLSTSANAWVETQGQIQSAMQSAKVWSVGDACELGVHFKATRSRRLRRLGQRNKTFTTHMCRFLLLLACTKAHHLYSHNQDNGTCTNFTCYTPQNIGDNRDLIKPNLYSLHQSEPHSTTFIKPSTKHFETFKYIPTSSP